MRDLVAKRYVKALLAGLSGDEFERFLKVLSEISSAFLSDKFKNIISSPTISGKQKIDLLLSFVDEKDEKFLNFIKLLGENNRLEILPNIVDELLLQKAKNDNIYHGKIYANEDISAGQVANLQESFSKKFNAKIILEVVKSDYNGIKIELDDLGVEASFSIDRLKAQMSEYILKAI